MFVSMFKEAYEEFKHVLLAFIYDKDDLTSPVASEVGCNLLVSVNANLMKSFFFSLFSSVRGNKVLTPVHPWTTGILYLFYSSWYICIVSGKKLWILITLPQFETDNRNLDIVFSWSKLSIVKYRLS